MLLKGKWKVLTGSDSFCRLWYGGIKSGLSKIWRNECEAIKENKEIIEGSVYCQLIDWRESNQY